MKKLRSKHPEWTFIDEPIATWSSICNERGENILELFYKDRKRWSYTFQNCALLTRFQYIEDTVSNYKKELAENESRQTQIFLTERCLDTDYHVFTKMLQADGSINTLEMQLYERLFRHLQAAATKLSAIIHVNSSPALCYERIKQRGRHGEEAITIEYLESLDNYQRQWIENTSIPTCSTDAMNCEEVERFLVQLEANTKLGYNCKNNIPLR